MKLAATLALLASPALASPQLLHCSEFPLEPLGNVHSEGLFPDEVAADGLVVLASDGWGPNHPGSVRVFEAGPEGTWGQTQVLTGDGASHEFGASIAVEGDRAFIGDWNWAADDAGRVHVFARAAVGGWSSVQVLSSPSAGFDSFGSRVGAGGDWLAVQARIDGTVLDYRVFLYRRAAATGLYEYTQMLDEPPGSFRFGTGLDIEGDVLLASDPVGHSLFGQAAVFRRDAADTWALEQVIHPPSPQYPGYFGRGVISDGELFLSAEKATGVEWSARGYRFAYDPLAASWNPVQTFTPNDVPPAGGELRSMLMRADGDLLTIGTPERGRVMVYRRDAAGTFQPEIAVGGGASFGETLAARGGVVAVGTTSIAGPGGSGILYALDLRLDDCNGNGAPDACDLANGFADLNANRVLDECEFSGAAYCGPAIPNSTGVAARLTGLGQADAGGALDLCATLMPVGSFGYLLGSSVQAFVAMPGASVGNLCLGGGPDFGRYTDQVQAADAAGRACALVDLGAVPTAGPPRALVAGETWNFQYWYRDGATSNFTAGLALLVQ